MIPNSLAGLLMTVSAKACARPRPLCLGQVTHFISGDRKREASSSWLLWRLLCWLLCWLLHRVRHTYTRDDSRVFLFETAPPLGEEIKSKMTLTVTVAETKEEIQVAQLCVCGCDSGATSPCANSFLTLEGAA